MENARTHARAVGSASARRPAVTPRGIPAAAAARPVSVPRALQQWLGNRGTQALAAQVVARSAAPGPAGVSSPSPGQLSISHPDDASEREAEQVAAAVMRMPEPTPQRSINSPSIRGTPAPLIQRRCAQCEEEDKGAKVQRKEISAEAPHVSPTVSADIRALNGVGSPLPAATRAFFEPRFGADFSQVRVHTDTHAARTASSISAKAFTVGRDIVFGAGQFAPDSAIGQHLLAHELTHTIQQRATSTSVSPVTCHDVQSSKSNISRATSVLIQRSWIGDRVNWVRTATHDDNWEKPDPPGAYYVLNGLSMDDMVQVLRALTPADRKKLSDNLDEHAAGFDRSRLQLALSNAAVPPADKAFRERSENLLWAIRSGNYANPPDGAFFLLSAAKRSQRDQLISALNRDALDALIAHRDEAHGVPGSGELIRAINLKRGGIGPAASPGLSGSVEDENVPMGGDYDDYKSNPDYIDNFNGAGYSPLSNTLHLFFADGGEAILTLPLKSAGVVLVFERKSFLNSPGPKDRKIYPTIKNRNTLPNVTQWLADHAEEIQQSNLMIEAGIKTLSARSLPPNLWWMALLSPSAMLGARFLAVRMRPSFGTLKGEKDETPVIRTPTPKGGGTGGIVMSEARAFTQARNARNIMVEAWKQLPKSQRDQIATVTGGVNVETGRVAGGYNTAGRCAEDMVVERLGGDASKVRFSEAVRPRTGQQVPVCIGCQGKYAKHQFAEGAIFAGPDVKMPGPGE